MNRQTTQQDGYTLIEVIVVTVILGIVGLVSSFVLMESIKTFTRISPAIQASYVARLATERLKHEIREIEDSASISAISPSAFVFVDATSTTVSFKLSGSDLYRNSDLLAEGLANFEFTYWTRDGKTTSDPAALHLVEIDLTAQVGGQSFRAQTAVYPRGLGQ